MPGNPLHRFVADRFAWVCAFWLHLVLFAVLNNAAYWTADPPPPSDPVSVEILEEPLLKPVPQPALPLAEDTSEPGIGARSAPEETPQAGTDGAANGWVTATSLLASSVLNDARSAQARKALATLTDADIGEQLCALEAMEQIRRDKPDFRPTRLAPHAFRISRRKGDMVLVPAGAIRSNRVWYEIAYRCRLAAGGTEITAFEYAFGKEIDRSLWDEHGLAPIH